MFALKKSIWKLLFIEKRLHSLLQDNGSQMATEFFMYYYYVKANTW
jgi:hypothetical protein